MKKPAFVLFVAIAALFFVYSRCNKQLSQSEAKQICQKYFLENEPFNDTVIDYKFSGDSLILTFPNGTSVRSWKLAIYKFTPERYDLTGNNIYMVDTNFRLYNDNDSSGFNLYATPLNNKAYYDNVYGQPLGFVYASNDRHQLKLLTRRNWFSVNLDFLKMKDTVLHNVIYDSIRKRLLSAPKYPHIINNKNFKRIKPN